MNITFPNINYNYWFSLWNKSVGEKQVYTNKNLTEYIKFDSDTNACTNEIIKLTNSNDLSQQTIFKVIDLIYSWGGRSGRMFYSRSKGKLSPREELEANDNNFKVYLDGIKLAKGGKTESIEKFSSIRGIGSSYASKHAYFWSIHSDNPLIIVDSKIAGTLGYKTIDSLFRDYTYKDIVNLFVAKAQLYFNEKNPSKVERALFAFHNLYFLNDNSGWKNKSESQDFDEALRIANILFEQ